MILNACVVPMDKESGVVRTFNPLETPPPKLEWGTQKDRIWESIASILLDNNSQSESSQVLELRQYAYKSLYGEDCDGNNFYEEGISSHELYRIYPRLVEKFFALGLGGIPDSNNVILKEAFEFQTRFTEDGVLFSGQGSDNGSVYEVYQSVHGDVSISQIPIGKQKELFPLDWKHLNPDNKTGFRLYQETSEFVTGLLIAYIRSGGNLIDLEGVAHSFGEAQHACCAADSGLKDIVLGRALYEIKDEILAKKTHKLTNEAGYITSLFGGGESYFDMNYTAGDSIIRIQNRLSRDPESACLINICDIPNLLRAMHAFPGRSGNFCKQLLKQVISLDSSSVSDTIRSV